jgi:hypothetical protein
MTDRIRPLDFVEEIIHESNPCGIIHRDTRREVLFGSNEGSCDGDRRIEEVMMG